MYDLLLWWWLLTTVLGWGMFGLAFPLMGALKDRGLFLGRYLGFLLWCFLLWIGGSLGVLPVTTFTCWLMYLAIVGGGVAMAWRHRFEVKSHLLGMKLPILVAEVMVLVAVLAFGMVRTYVPEVDGFAEKMPDMAFLNACYTATTFPPEDTWASGETINYFYYGQYTYATLCKLTGTHPRWGYNAGLVMVFVYIMITAFGVVFNLLGRVRIAFLGAIFTGVMGNLDGVVQKLIEGNPGYNWWQSSRVMVRDAWINGEWTRVDETINEFPFWSFVLGDLHAHVLAVPLLLVNLGLLYLLLRSEVSEELFAGKPRALLTIALAAVGLGATPATNYWEVPTITLLLVGTFLLRLLKQTRDDGRRLPELLPLLREAVTCAAVGVTALVFYLPFHLNFARTQSDGIGWVRPEMQSSGEHFLTIFGFFLFMAFSFLVHILHEHRERGALPEKAGLVTGAVALLGWQLNSFPLMIMGLGVIGFSFVIVQMRLNKAAMFACFLTVMAFCQLIGVEYIFIEDWYGGALDRMNTIFKFYYQAWVLLAVAGAYFVGVLMMILQHGARLVTKVLWFATFGALLIGSLIFTVYGPGARSQNFRNQPALDTMAYMEQRYPEDFAAIPAILELTEPGDVVMEAEGEAFSMYGRIAAFTGRPTPLGWGHHQSLWRDKAGGFTAEREREVREMYETTDVNRFRELAEKYDVRFVYIGHLENARYNRDGQAKFEQLGEKIFEQGASRLYRLR